MNAVCHISSQTGNDGFSLLSLPAKYANGNPKIFNLPAPPHFCHSTSFRSSVITRDEKQCVSRPPSWAWWSFLPHPLSEKKILTGVTMPA